MTHLPLVTPAPATAPVQRLLAEVRRRQGTTPNMTRAMANSPALLQGYLDLSGALSRGVLSPATRERIALAGRSATAATNAWPRTATSPSAPRTWAQATSRPPASPPRPPRRLRRSSPSQPLSTTAAAPSPARTWQPPETIGHVALTILTSYFNKAADVALDFPARGRLTRIGPGQVRPSSPLSAGS